MAATTKKAKHTSNGIGSALRHSPAAGRLVEEARNYAVARAGGLVGSPLRGARIGALGAGLKDKAVSLLGRQGSRSGGRSSPKVTTIIEDIDVGAPVSVVYDQWTQFQEFSSFTKGVESVEQTDDVQTTWRGKVWWSRRTWTATITDQVPDRRIAWTSEGGKGTTAGVVTFHPLADDLTKVLLVLEYHPAGAVEKTANLWRAAGRRARLDLKHFRRFVSMRGEPTGSWRGEIRDAEVVRGPGKQEDEPDEMDESDER
jgi:uncharacterized membrane protein